MIGNKTKEIIEKLEVFYLANKSENLYFTVLGDATKSKKQVEEKDSEIVKIGIYEIERLNKKYPKAGIPRFNFIYRKRLWNEKENSYLGWERKRGLLTELNDYLIFLKDNKSQNSIFTKIRDKKENSFIINTIEDFRIKKPNEKKLLIFVLRVSCHIDLYVQKLLMHK